jgi:lysylphosphatidylglycerol synthetase-like protein (DUF2156 family)
MLQSMNEVTDMCLDPESSADPGPDADWASGVREADLLATSLVSVSLSVGGELFVLGGLLLGGDGAERKETFSGEPDLGLGVEGERGSQGEVGPRSGDTQRRERVPIELEMLSRLEHCEGPICLVLNGHVFAPSVSLAELPGVLECHHEFFQRLAKLSSRQGCSVHFLASGSDAWLTHSSEARCLLSRFGIRTGEYLDVRMATFSGERLIRVDPGDEPLGSPVPWGGASSHNANWLSGSQGLFHQEAYARFVWSRLVYRRIGRWLWLLAIPVALILAARIPLIYSLFANSVPTHLAVGHVHLRRAMVSNRPKGWRPYLALSLSGLLVGVVLMAGILAFLGRIITTALSELPARAGPGPNQETLIRERARELLEHGYAGVVNTCAGLPELSDLSSPGGPAGFYANTGFSTQVLTELPSRLGLPPVFRSQTRASLLRVEAGGELRAHLELATRDEGASTFLERLVAPREKGLQGLHSVAVWPHGTSWPPTGKLASRRRVQRIAAGAIALTGALNLVSAALPPWKARLHILLSLIPLVATQAAAALVAITGIALLALARGIRLGQKRAWTIATCVLLVSVLLNLLRGIDAEESLVSLLLAGFLLVNRKHFQANSQPRSFGNAVKWLVGGVVLATFGVSLALEGLRWVLDRRDIHLPSFYGLLGAVAERLIGDHSMALAHPLSRFLDPAMLAIGLGLLAAILFMATAPVRLRRRSRSSESLAAARDIVERYGQGTLDWFALRCDKEHFIWRDTLVAYAVFNGVCLVSPDPVGPISQRRDAFNAFRDFAHAHGWEVAVIGAGEEWLETYEAFGMHHVYLGDEAVVDLKRFALEGKKMKGLRQAHNRIAKYGYRIAFYDPARIGTDLRGRLEEIMGVTRRGDFERGFSMTLGRMFDPADKGLLLAVAIDKEGKPVAFCHYVPARGIGGYSLDVMRHDGGDHPNGLLDFVLVETILHLREQGMQALGLNFAAMRAVLDGTMGQSVPRRLEKRFFQWISNSAQVESLFRFNAKFQPDWLARYAVFDSMERLLPTAVAMLRAEQIWELPLVGRFLAPAGKR